MATLLELATIESDSLGDISTATGDELLAIKLRLRVRMAAIEQAAAILVSGLDEVSKVDVAWSRIVMSDPDTIISRLFRVVLAASSGNTYSQILNASDANIAAAVAVPLRPIAET